MVGVGSKASFLLFFMMLILNLSHRSILCSTETSQCDSTQSFPNLLLSIAHYLQKDKPFHPHASGSVIFFNRTMAKVKSMPHCLVQQSRFVQCPKMQAPQTPWFSKGIFLGAFTQLVCKTQLQCHAHTVIYKWIHMSKAKKTYQTVQLDLHHSKCLRLTVVWAKFDIIYI